MDFDDFYKEEDQQEGQAEAGGVDELFMYSGLEQSEIDLIRDQKDAVIFLVDCAHTMFEKNPHNPDQSNSILQVLKATLSFMKSKIITSDSDKIGLILYNSA
jgi:hypothetical protein